VRIRGRRYPVVVPTRRDPRLQLTCVIISLHVLGQLKFDFEVSIAQILVSLLTCAVLEVAVAFWRRRALVWPASALLTGNGVAFVLRVPGTQHGDWWSMRGAWIFAATGAISLLSKYAIRVRGRHVFNPSNFGLLACFLILGPRRADPLDLWWGPMSPSMALALAIILVGGLVILSRLRLLSLAVAFGLAFAGVIGILAATGHCITARWHVGPICDRAFWVLLVTSPEILVFSFFMITDPKTIPIGRASRMVYAVAVAIVAALLIAPQRTEFGTKVAVLGALALVCAARPLLESLFPAGSERAGVAAWLPVSGLARGRLAIAGIATLAICLFAAGMHARSSDEVGVDAGRAANGRDAGLPTVRVTNDRLSRQISLESARVIAADVVEDLRIQADALRRLDRSLVASAATGAWRTQLEKQIVRSRNAGEIVVPTYDLEEVIVSVARRKVQRAPAILATVRGSVSAGGDAQRFEGTFEVKRIRSRFLLASDQPPEGWSPPS
jgi:hypothetical protein